jgi:ATP-dependent Clp protease ATP-binding subunit ClpA
LKRAIEKYVENPLSTKLLKGEFGQGDTIIVGLGDKGLTFSVKRGADVSA